MTNTWHCRRCPQPTGLRFVPQTFATGEEHVRMHCGGCGAFIRYAPKTRFVLALAACESNALQGQTTDTEEKR